MALLFWISFGIVFYTYIGYGFLLFILTRMKAVFLAPQGYDKRSAYEPAVTLIVAAYNEEDYIEEKIENTLRLDYPKDKLFVLFVTDGSTDKTLDRIRAYPYPEGAQVKWEHEEGRKGKIAAVDRVMPSVRTPVVIYSDANAQLNPAAVRNIVRHYQDPKVGGVAGEKRILMEQEGEAAAASGEGLYWKYESLLKKLDYQLYSCIGAAGELFSLRTELYETPSRDSIIEDFMLSMAVNQRGYKMAYEPDAYACETSSANVEEEMKRKVRISAGGYQAFFRLLHLLNPFRYGTLSFQYFSHRVLRWIFAPIALIPLFLSNLFLALQGIPLYQVLFAGQLLFYSLALAGYLLRNNKVKIKVFFIPYYFTITNLSQILGGLRYFSGKQSVVWEKSRRAPARSSKKN
jgi:cellulose synthase/poly-beta-1,6-N-acetylglucosamine synthase-like glycosyltransferase